MDTQRIASIVRQAVAVAAIVMGPVTAEVSALKLPPAVSGIITAGGFAVIALEHYLSDPSTGNTSPPAMPPSAVTVIHETPVAAPIPPGSSSIGATGATGQQETPAPATTAPPAPANG